MPEWKKNIFVAAVKARMEQEHKTFDEVVKDYPKLTESEVKEIRQAIMGV